MTGRMTIGNTTVYASEGVIPEANGQMRFKVPLIRVGHDASVPLRSALTSFFFVNAMTIFSAIEKAGIVFDGPAPFDRDHDCMRFMFEHDATAFFNAFRQPDA